MVRSSSIAKAKTDPYFVGPWTDFMFIGGLSLLVLPLLFPLSSEPYYAKVLEMAFLAQIIVNFPHFSATIYRLYRKKENIAAFPLTSYVIPPVIAAFTVIALQFPAYFAAIFILIYLLWSPYHFSGQSSGITMIYARRNGYFIGRRERLFMSGFIFSSFLLNFIWLMLQGGYTRAAIRSGGSGGLEETVGMAFTTLNIPEWVQYPVALAVVVCAVGFFYLITRQAVEKGRRYPELMVFLPALSHFFWFTFSARFGILAFIAFVPLFHSLQYLFVAWAVQMRERRSERAAHKLDIIPHKETAVWYVLNILGGCILFLILPHFLAGIFQINFWTSFFIVAVGIQLHHFFVDGVIWKLRDPDAFAALTTRVGSK